MNRKLVITLVALSALFFLVSLYVFLNTGRGAAGYEPEVVNKVSDGRSEVVSEDFGWAARMYEDMFG